jgi:hypothetical protein
MSIRNALASFAVKALSVDSPAATAPQLNCNRVRRRACHHSTVVPLFPRQIQ